MPQGGPFDCFIGGMAHFFDSNELGEAALEIRGSYALYYFFQLVHVLWILHKSKLIHNCLASEHLYISRDGNLVVGNMTLPHPTYHLLMATNTIAYDVL